TIDKLSFWHSLSSIGDRDFLNMTSLPVSWRRAKECAPSAAAAKPGKRARLQGEIAKAQRCAGHSREASTAFSEARTAYSRIMSRIGANAFKLFRRAALHSAPSSSRCQRDISCGSAHID